jgi:hypothetical protein
MERDGGISLDRSGSQGSVTPEYAIKAAGIGKKESSRRLKLILSLLCRLFVYIDGGSKNPANVATAKILK